MIHAGLPSGPEWQRPELRERYAAESGRRRFAAKAQLAASGGAVAVVAIEEPAYASAIASGADAPAAVFYTPFERDEEAGLPIVRLSAAAGDAILAAAGPADQALSSAAPRAPARHDRHADVRGRRTPGAQPERHRHDSRIGSGAARRSRGHRRAHGSPRAVGRQDCTRAPTTTRRASRRCWKSPGRSRQAAGPRSAPSSSRSGPARKKAISGPRTTCGTPCGRSSAPRSTSTST